MYLIRIDMERSSRAVRSAMADCQQMHRLVMGLFEKERQQADVLYRIKDQGMNISLYIYSAIPVQEERLIPGMKLGGQREISAWLNSLNNGRCLRFDLLAMPAKKVCTGGKNSQRRVLRTLDERVNWLVRKAEQNGFRLLDVMENGRTSFLGFHKAGAGEMHWDAFHYTGALQITDEALFRHAVQRGIGAGKAYGLGMLLLA